MGAHIVNGQFKSDKYPTCPPGKVPLSVKDKTAQDLLWEYARRRQILDDEFSDDLRTALRAAGYDPSAISVGDVVRLKSGGPIMTVYRLNEGSDNDLPTASCVWNVTEKPFQCDFAIVVLTKA